MADENPLNSLLGDLETTESTEPTETKPTESDDELKATIAAMQETVKSLTDTVTNLQNEKTENTEETEEEKPFVPNTWEDVVNKAKEIADETYEQRVARQAEEAEEAKRQESIALKTIDDEFNKQLSEAEKQGLLTVVKDKKDPNDPGVQERREVFGRAAAYGTTNLLGIAQELKTLHESGIHWDNSAKQLIRTKTSGFNKQIPVSSSSSRTGSTNKELDYKTLHNLSMDEIIRRETELS
jgi:hypothetical protein